MKYKIYLEQNNDFSQETKCFSEKEIKVISCVLNKWIEKTKEFPYLDIDYNMIFDFFNEAQEETGINYDWETGDNNFNGYLIPDNEHCYHLKNFYIENCND